MDLQTLQSVNRVNEVDRVPDDDGQKSRGARVTCGLEGLSSRNWEMSEEVALSLT